MYLIYREDSRAENLLLFLIYVFFPYLNFFRNEILKNCNYTDNY